MAGHFLAVVIQLLAADRYLQAARVEALAQALEDLAHLGVALLHRQLEVDHRLAAKPFADQVSINAPVRAGFSTMSQTIQSTRWRGRYW